MKEKYYRVSALWVGGETVQVLFRTDTGKTVGKFMSRAVYGCFPVGSKMTLEEFEDHMPNAYMLDAPSEFITCFE